MSGRPAGAAYGALLLACLPVGKAVVFALLHQALFGLHLGMAFAPNHKGMEMPGPAGERWGHLRRQVLTSRYDKRGYVFLGTATTAALVIWLRTWSPGQVLV
ncbi:hypothetical protein SSPO_002900 [Streptomyces antimycoticus]|uniref:Uncharacterized protein n=1 Tax=Streptomyces antimycoticus TaxID=68175 RepID=A0A499UBZ9_9ACTN|nr:hypothetical protein SSPO_002900 [Streptomyces antimycoticus]